MTNFYKLLTEAKKKKMDAVDKDELDGSHDEREDGDIDNDGDEDSSDEYLHGRRKAISKAIAKTKMKKEEVEELDELSKKTLGSYVKKADDDRAQNAFKVGKSGKINFKGMKRSQGIKTAVNKLTKEEAELDEAKRKGAPKMTGDSFAAQREKDAKHNEAMGRTKTGRKKPARTMTSTQRSLASLRNEEAEELDEVSKKTLSSYTKKASGTVAGIAANMATDAAKGRKAHPDDKRQLRNRLKGIERASDKMTKEEAELDEAMTAKQRALAKADETAQKKKDVSLKKAPWDKKNEEVEELDEISSKTLTNYMAKASDSKKHKGLSGKKVDNRFGGVKAADDKLRKKDGYNSPAKVAATEEVEDTDNMEDMIKSVMDAIAKGSKY